MTYNAAPHGQSEREIAELSMDDGFGVRPTGPMVCLTLSQPLGWETVAP